MRAAEIDWRFRAVPNCAPPQPIASKPIQSQLQLTTTPNTKITNSRLQLGTDKVKLRGRR